MLMRHPTQAPKRRGVILMVVLALLTLFAIVGITFVLYADGEANAARIAREAEYLTRPDINPEIALSMFLGQFIYDVNDLDNVGIYSGLRGQSLARGIYGYNPGGLNDKPFNGTGRIHYPSPFGGQPNTGFAADNAYLVNFTYFPGDGWLRDPERLGTRANSGAPEGQYVGGFNVPYTYPDHQNFFLAMMRPSDGMILVPSFHRPWLFGSMGSGPGGNANWTNQWGKYLTLRPRPADMGPGSTFPYPPVVPGGINYDVKNLDWAPGGNDSIWIDINAPVMVSPDGRKYKMLVAPLVLEMDSRLNLNVLGNILGTGNTHASNQGWGITEVNPNKILFNNAAEYANLFLGNPQIPYNPAGASNPLPTPHVVGRYGTTGFPQGVALQAGTGARSYAGADLNGTLDPSPNGLTPNNSFLFPGFGGNVQYTPFPFFNVAQGYGNGVPLETTNGAGTPNHPLIYNSQRPNFPNRSLPVNDMAALLRYGGTGSSFLTSDLFRLLPQNMQNPRTRNLTTLLSADLDLPGLVPYVWNPNDASMPPTRYQFNTNPLPPPPAPLPPLNTWGPLAPFGQPISFPALPPAGAPPAGSEFDPATWRSILSLQGRVDLNRSLTPYPAPYPSTGRFNLGNMNIQQQYTQALADRTQFANDIFNALRAATGCLDPATAYGYGNTNMAPEYRAARYLAQLAVNIVDYIDQDDYITPFQWDRTSANAGNQDAWVFGTEIPRLVLNEIYIQYDNDPGDINGGGGKATANYWVNIWAELLNPLVVEDGVINPNQAILQDAAAPGANVYQLLIADPNMLPAPGISLTSMRTPENVLGALIGPDGPTLQQTVNNWGANANGFQWSVQPINGAYNSTPGKNNGFYVIGPNPPPMAGKDAPTYPTSTDPQFTTTTTSGNMSYKVPVTNVTLPSPTLLLQRLACPGLPPQGNPGQPNYNPYVTVDYQEARAAQVNDVRTLGTVAALAPPPGPQTALANRVAWGRRQPYSAVYGNPVQSQLTKQNTKNMLPANQPNNTFYQHNAREAPAAMGTTTLAPWSTDPTQTLTVPFNWLVQLDRQVISPMELLHVSGFKPHELTQQFVQPDAVPANNPDGIRYQHMAPWLDQPGGTSTPYTPSARLYRFFELAQTRSWAAGNARGGRVLGKVNINMIWDPAILQALCDAQPANLFYGGAMSPDQNVLNVYQTLVGLRSPTSDGAGGFMPGAPVSLGGNLPDQPIWPLTMGYAMGGDALDVGGVPAITNPPPPPSQRGINNTLLRFNANGKTLQLDPFGPDANNNTQMPPYQRYQLLTKIFNNVTTRSNVFAVWLTVGFFEVTNDTVFPVQLGAEIGLSENKQIRHRMFALIDRTNIQTFGTASSAAITLTNNAWTNQPMPQTVPFQLAQMNGTTPSGLPWAVQTGMALVFDANNNNEETVIVQNGPMPGQFQATFTRSHLQGCPVINRGNPGPFLPPLRYDPRNDPLVVPYFAVID